MSMNIANEPRSKHVGRVGWSCEGDGVPMPRITAYNKAIPSPRKHAPNKLEGRYGDHLLLQHRQGLIKGFGFQRYTLRLGDDLRYTPDYHVVANDDRLIFDEVKGFMREDARVKIVAAAEMFPHLFRLVTWDKVDGWKIEEI